MESPIDHKTNFNGKLYCKAYTQIHLWNSKRYTAGKEVEVRLRGNPIHIAEIVSTTPYELQKLPAYCCYLDTGYSKKETIAMIRKMYPSLSLQSLVGVALLKVIRKIGLDSQIDLRNTINPCNAEGQLGTRPTVKNLSVQGDGRYPDLAGHPLPLYLTISKEKEDIRLLAIYVAESYKHALVIETEGKVKNQNNQRIIHAVRAINPHVKASHFGEILQGINSVRYNLDRKIKQVQRQKSLF